MFFLYFIAGITAGLLAGLLGIGGGILFTPVLFYIFTTAKVDHPVQWTIGSAMFCIFCASLSSVYRHRRQHNLHIPEGLKVGTAGIIGTFFGLKITSTPYYDRKEFVIFFSVLMIFSSVMFIWKSRRSYIHDETEESRRLEWMPALLTGCLGGLVASLAGVGGGIVMVPLLTLLFHVNMHRTAGISSLAIAIITGVTCLQYIFLYHPAVSPGPFSIGFVDFSAAFPLAAGGILGASLGARLNPKFSRRALQWIFALIALLVTSRLMFANLF